MDETGKGQPEAVFRVSASDFSLVIALCIAARKDSPGYGLVSVQFRKFRFDAAPPAPDVKPTYAVLAPTIEGIFITAVLVNDAEFVVSVSNNVRFVPS